MFLFFPHSTTKFPAVPVCCAPPHGAGMVPEGGYQLAVGRHLQCRHVHKHWEDDDEREVHTRQAVHLMPHCNLSCTLTCAQKDNLGNPRERIEGYVFSLEHIHRCWMYEPTLAMGVGSLGWPCPVCLGSNTAYTYHSVPPCACGSAATSTAADKISGALRTWLQRV
jgi:hypothetical protein